MCTVQTHRSNSAATNPNEMKYKDMHSRNSHAHLQLSNNSAEKRQNPGAVPSENFHSYLMSTIIIPVIGAFHLEATPNLCRAVCTFDRLPSNEGEALVWDAAAILCYLQCPWAPSRF